MVKAKYQGEIYNIVENLDGIEIIFHGEKEGFQRRSGKKGVISYKRVNKDELDAMYQIKFYAVWKGERFEFDYMQGTSVIRLWRFTGSTELVDKYDFRIIDKWECAKEVEIQECDYFVMVYKDYLDRQKSVEEVVVPKTDFQEAYRKYLYE